VTLVLTPLAILSGSVGVGEGPEPMRFVVLPLSVLDVSVGMLELSLAMLLAVAPVPALDPPVAPVLRALAMHRVVKEHSFVDGAAGSIGVAEGPESVCFVLPLSVLDAAVGLNELSLSVGLVVLLGASLLRAVLTGQGTSAVSVTRLIPGAFLSGSVVQHYRTSLDQRSIFGYCTVFIFVLVAILSNFSY